MTMVIMRTVDVNRLSRRSEQPNRTVAQPLRRHRGHTSETSSEQGAERAPTYLPQGQYLTRPSGYQRADWRNPESSGARTDDYSPPPPPAAAVAAPLPQLLPPPPVAPANTDAVAPRRSCIAARQIAWRRTTEAGLSRPAGAESAVVSKSTIGKRGWISCW